jgi:arylsulfatase A-like enzyme
MVARLRANGLLDSTLFIVTAKHGQSPIDHNLVARIDGGLVASTINAAAPIDGYARDAGNGHIEDDVGLYWLASHDTATAAAAALTPTAALDPHVDTVFTTANPLFKRMFGDPAVDDRTPDVVLSLKKGTIYSLSQKKWAEHGGFADDDSNVALLVSNPALHEAVVTTAVRTKQVAPTILRALRLDPRALDGVRKEGTRVLPGLPLEE